MVKKACLSSMWPSYFSSRQQFSNEVIPFKVNKTMEHHVLLAFIDAIIVTTAFDSWMSWGGFDTFVLVMNYINKKWESCHVIVGIFDVHETLRATMAIQLKDFLTQYNLLNKVIAYVKVEGTNLNTLIVALTNIVSCVRFLLPQPYTNYYYGHVVSKCYLVCY